MGDRLVRFVDAAHCARRCGRGGSDTWSSSSIAAKRKPTRAGAVMPACESSAGSSCGRPTTERSIGRCACTSCPTAPLSSSVRIQHRDGAIPQLILSKDGTPSWHAMPDAGRRDIPALPVVYGTIATQSVSTERLHFNKGHLKRIKRQAAPKHHCHAPEILDSKL